ncbi:MAG: 50S ribosomal protein L29 [Alphaproteobacteria bacterium]|nr:50S ribosomal protein L29 [Alphaproteobacteria bacterium]
MSKNIKTDLSKSTDKELIEIITKEKKELMSLRFKSKLGELSNTSLFSRAKKTIAQVYTELNKRKKL